VPPGVAAHSLEIRWLTSEPSGGASGQASDIALHAKEILRIRASLTDIYAEHCTRPDEERASARERFERALERDYFMSAQEAVEFGIVDKIVERRVEGDGKGTGAGARVGEKSG
jgi:ATP-dependent Clp protease protease subunit